jgi:hypothetical protein
MTWNLAGAKDYNKIDAVTLMTSCYHNKVPDICFIGFQETVELGIFSTLFFGHDKNNNQILKEKFQ